MSENVFARANISFIDGELRNLHLLANAGDKFVTLKE